MAAPKGRRAQMAVPELTVERYQRILEDHKGNPVWATYLAICAHAADVHEYEALTGLRVQVGGVAAFEGAVEQYLNDS